MTCLKGIFAGKNTVGDEKTTPLDQEGCSANSFMIADSVCDEVTNIERCLYDGGDCCKPDKSTPFCQDCTCRQTVDKAKFRQAMEDYNIHILSVTLIFGPPLVSYEHQRVEEVESPGVCAVLCLDPELDLNINAWKFDEKTRDCQCAWIGNQICHTCFKDLMEPIDVDKFVNAKAAVQLSKTLPCGSF